MVVFGKYGFYIMIVYPGYGFHTYVTKGTNVPLLHHWNSLGAPRFSRDFFVNFARHNFGKINFSWKELSFGRAAFREDVIQ